MVLAVVGGGRGAGRGEREIMTEKGHETGFQGAGCVVSSSVCGYFVKIHQAEY